MPNDVDQKSWPMYKLQSECKRHHLSTTGQQKDLIQTLTGPRPHGLADPFPTPDFQAYAEDPTTYLEMMEYQLQEICNERDLEVTGSKHVLTERLLKDDMGRFTQKHAGKFSPTEYTKRKDYERARIAFANKQNEVLKAARVQHYELGKKIALGKFENQKIANAKELKTILDDIFEQEKAEVAKREQDLLRMESTEKLDAVDPHLDEREEAILDGDSDFEVLSDDLSWLNASKVCLTVFEISPLSRLALSWPSLVEPEANCSKKSRKNHHSSHSHNVDDDETPEAEPITTPSGLGASAAATTLGAQNKPVKAGIERATSATTSSATSITPANSASSTSSSSSSSSATSKVETSSVQKRKEAFQHPFHFKKAKIAPGDLSDNALMNVPDRWSHLVAPHPVPMLQRVSFADVSAFIHIKPEAMTVRRDRMLAMKKLLGTLIIRGTSIKVEIKADPTGTYIFYLSGWDKWTMIQAYWKERGNSLSIFSKNIAMKTFDSTGPMIAENDRLIAAAQRERDAQNWGIICAKAKAVRLFMVVVG